MANPSFKTLLLADYRMDGAEAQFWLLSYPKYVSEKRLMQAYWWSGRGVRIFALLISKNEETAHRW
ncbi:hypothetical protein EGW74_14500 [Enterococcus casseliflavus]|nr:hypothetical protein EGW74_14500 [Enterococcus casseliflavus]